MSAYSEDTISAFVDGELDPAVMAEIETAAVSDAELAAQIETYRNNDATLLRAVDDLLNDTAAAPAAPATTSDGSNVIAFRQKKPAAETPRRWVPAAIAAGLALALGVYGSQVYFRNAAQGSAQDGIVASASFSDALSHLASGETGKVEGGAMRVALSFRAKDKRYCREFAVGFAGGSGAGVACNTGGTWQIEGWASSPAKKSDGEYRTAGGPDDVLVERVMKRLGVTEALDSAGERDAIRAGWAQGR
jgi:hypothetical protein